MNNYEKAITLSEEALGSEGAAMEKYGYYQDSIAAKMDRITASWQEFIIKMKESEVVGDILSGIEELMSALASDAGTFVTGVVAPTGILITTLSGAISKFKDLSVAKKTAAAASKVLEKAEKDLTYANDRAQAAAWMYETATKKGILVDKAKTHLTETTTIQSRAQTAAIEANTRAVIANNEAKKITSNAYALMFTAIATAAYLAVVAIDHFTITDKELRDNIEKTTDALDGYRDELKELEKQYKENKERLKELQDLAKEGNITPSQKDEIADLKEKIDLLDIEIAKKRELAKLEEQEAQKQADELANRKIESKTQMAYYDPTQGRMVGKGLSRADALRENISLIDEEEKKLEEYRRERERLDEKGISAGSPERTKLAEKEADAQDRINELTKENVELAEDLKNIKLYSTIEGEVKDAGDALELLVRRNETASEQFDRIFGSVNNRQAKKELVDFANSGKLTADSLKNSSNAIVVAWKNEGGELETLVAGVKEYAEAEQAAANAVDTVIVANKSYGEIASETKDKISAVNAAKKELSETGYLTIDAVQKLQKEFGNLQIPLKATDKGFVTTTEDLETLYDTTLAQYRLELENAKKAARETIQAETGKAVAYNTTTEALYAQLLALKKNVKFSDDFMDETGKSVNFAAEHKKWIESGNQEILDVAEALKNAQDNLGKAEEILGMSSSVTKSGKVGSSSTTDPLDKIYENQLKALKNRLKIIQHQADVIKEIPEKEKEYIGLLDQEKEIYQKIQDLSHSEAERKRSQGFTIDDNEVADKMEEWWAAYEKIQDASKEMDEAPFENRKNALEHQIYLTEQLAEITKDTDEEIRKLEEQNLDNGLTEQEKARLNELKKNQGNYEDYLNNQNTLYIQMQKEVHDRAEELREQGVSEEDERIKDLQQIWWDYEAKRRALAKETYDYRRDLLDDEIDRSERALSELQRVVDDLMRIRKNQLDDELRTYDYLIKQNEAYIASFEGLWSITDKVRQEQKNIADELKINKESYKYLDEELRKTLFNEDDYNTLSKMLSKIEESAKDVYDSFRAEIENLTEFDIYKVEEITSEYQRQYNMKMMEYEIAKAEMNVVKKQTELQNVLANRNVRMFTGNQWVWTSDYKAVQNAMEAVADAENERNNAEIKKNQQMVIDWYNKQIDSLKLQSEAAQNWYDELERQWERIQSQLQIQEKSLSTVLENILDSDVPTLRTVLSNVGGEFLDFIAILGSNKDFAEDIFGDKTNQQQPGGSAYDRQYLENKIAWQKAYERGDKAEMERLAAANAAYREANNIPTDVITYEDALRMLQLGLYRDSGMSWGSSGSGSSGGNSSGGSSSWKPSGGSSGSSSSGSSSGRVPIVTTPPSSSSGGSSSGNGRVPIVTTPPSSSVNYDKDKDYTTAIRDSIAKGDYAQAEYDLKMKEAKEADMKKAGTWDDSWSNVDDLRKEIDASKKKKYDRGGILDGVGGIKATSKREVVFDEKLTAKVLDPVRSKEFLNVADGLSKMLDSSVGLGSIIKAFASASVQPASTSITDSHDIYLPEGFMAKMTKQDSESFTSIIKRYIPITK